MEDKIKIECSFDLFYYTLEPNLTDTGYSYKYSDGAGELTLNKEAAEFLMVKFSEEIEFFNRLQEWLDCKRYVGKDKY